MKRLCLAILFVSVFIAGCYCTRGRRDHDDDHDHERRHRKPSAHFHAKLQRGGGAYRAHHPPPRPYMSHGYYGPEQHRPYYGFGQGYGHYDHYYDDHHDDDDHDDDHSDSDDDHDDDHSDDHDDDHHDDDHDDDHHDDDHDPHSHIWRFQIGDNFGAYEYLDAQGHAMGFHIDLMRAVCERAHKTCFFTVDAYRNCWNTEGGQERPGVGLMDHYYDGCIGLLPTPDRLNSFNFTQPFAPNFKCGLLYKPGVEQTDEEAHNITGKKIGFVDGWALSKRCLERQEGYVGNDRDHYTPVLFETHKTMSRALLEGDIDAMLTVDAFDMENHKLSLLQPTFSCTLGGSSVMTQYGSEVLHWWNDAFQQMKEDGSFRELCTRSIEEHRQRGRVTCLHD